VQEQQVTKVGGIRPIVIDVRFVVATNRNLESMVAEGEFRHDLYHRLNVVKFSLPPLKNRSDDIPLLIQHFTTEICAQYGRSVKGFDAKSMKQLCEYSWPGNVRELRNMVERHIALADDEVLVLKELPNQIQANGSGIDSDMPSLEELEKRYICKILDQNGGNREKTATTLDINKSTLWRKLQQYSQDEKPE